MINVHDPSNFKNITNIIYSQDHRVTNHFLSHAIPPGTYKEAESCRAGSNYVTIHKLNDLNAEKIPAQQWPELQATCSLGTYQGSHTLGTFHYILPYLTSVTSRGFEALFSVTLSHQEPARRSNPVEQGVTTFTILSN